MHILSMLSEEDKKKIKKKKQPEWLDPMLAKLTHKYFSGEEWLFERKLDGERGIAFVDNKGKVRLMSRNKKIINNHYPEICEALKKQVTPGCMLDGEIVAFNKQGVSDFQKLQSRIQSSGNHDKTESDLNIFYYIFDCMYVEGHDITNCACRTRKNILKRAVDWQSPLQFTPHRNDDGLEYYKEACKKGWEGLIAKHAESTYVHSRSSNWLKFKCIRQQEFVIGGFTEPEGERIGFGALLLGFYRNGKLIYAGKVGTGYDDETLKDLRNRMDDLKQKTSPYDEGEPDEKKVHFVKPELVCQVVFTEWTEDDKLRHPRYKGLREDKNAREVHQEKERQAADL